MWCKQLLTTTIAVGRARDACSSKCSCVACVVDAPHCVHHRVPLRPPTTCRAQPLPHCLPGKALHLAQVPGLGRQEGVQPLGVHGALHQHGDGDKLDPENSLGAEPISTLHTMDPPHGPTRHSHGARYINHKQSRRAHSYHITPSIRPHSSPPIHRLQHITPHRLHTNCGHADCLFLRQHGIHSCE